MAELVGVVASGISIATLAAQIANSVIKLKGYWSDLKEAPEDIRLLIEEVEDIQVFLSEIEEDQRRNPISRTASGSISASRCLERCKRGADLLRNLADELGAEITSTSKRKKAWASAKVILKKDRLEKYKLQLERALRIALVGLQPDIIVSQLTHSATFLSHLKSLVTTAETIQKDQPVTSCQSLVSSSTLRRTMNPSPETEDDVLAVQHERVQQSTLVSRLRLQVWFINQAWNAELLRSSSGWTFNIRVHNVIPWNSSTFHAIRSGDVSMLQELFRKGQASPLDMFPLDFCNSYYTLLDVAITSAHPAMCEFLLQQSASTDEQHYSAFRSKLDIIADNIAMKAAKTENVITIAPMLREYESYQSSDPRLLITMTHWFRGSEKVFQLFKQFLNIPYHELPLETRVHAAVRIAQDAEWNSPKVFEMALDEHPISADAIAMHVPRYGTLLNAVATAIGSIMGGETDFDCWVTRRNYKDLPGWRAFLCELVTRSADLHSASNTYCDGDDSFEVSPFLCLFLGLTKHSRFENARYIAPMVEAWLESLLSCGIDLLEYGRKEKAWQQRRNVIKRFRSSYGWEYNDHYLYEWTLIGFDYGPSPSDWHIYMSDPWAELAGVFWQSIEHPEPLIPGSWLD